jgi:four helix bundle protein
MKDFRKLKVWDRAHQLTLEIYKATSFLPKDELFGLTAQIRRSCVSIPANVAEGCGRGSQAEFGRFLQVAMGSASELEYHLLLAHDLGYLSLSVYQKTSAGVVEIKRMLSSLIRKLKADS